MSMRTLLVMGLTLSLWGCKDDEGDTSAMDASVSMDGGGGSTGGDGPRDTAAPGDAAPAADAAPARDSAPTGDGPRPGDGPPAAMCPAAPAELECEPVLEEVVPLGDKRVRHCAFDVGSTNVRVIVTSMVL